MKSAKVARQSRILLVAVTAVLGILFALPSTVHAQCTSSTHWGYSGNNAVYGTCKNGVGGAVAIQGSAAYIDASAVPQGTDFCKTIYNIITSTSNTSGYTVYPSGGAVIDARGISGTLSCAAGSTPWIQGASVTSAPATILLPAENITIYTTWIVPEFSRVIGEGPGLTMVTAGTGFAANSAESPAIDAMIEMGTAATSGNDSNLLPFCNSNNDCVGVGIQDLTLNLSGATVAVQYGIYNAAAQELSYVNNVTFSGVGSSASNETYALEITVPPSGTLGAGSSNSGPYSNLICNIATGDTSGTTRCVDLRAHTRGVHGISCYGNGTPTAAIYLDSDSDSIEDAYINGFVDGIYVGSQGNAPSNVLFNISGGTNMTHLIHICGPSDSCMTPSTITCPGGTINTCDLTIMNATAAANTTIQDDVTGTALSNTSKDAVVGLYILGEQIGSGTNAQYSRFTTSPRVPTWSIGNTSPSSSCTTTGSLFSDVAASGSSAQTLFACLGGTWANIK